MRPAIAIGWVGVVLLVVPISAAAESDLMRQIARLRAVSGVRASVDPPWLRSAATLPASGRGRACGGEAWRARAAREPARTQRAVRDASLRFGVDRRLVESVIRHESAGDVGAVSHAGAEGLMQLMPATARSLGVVCSFDPRENVLGGTRYLRELRDQFGDWSCAIAAYNAGPARVERGVLPAETRTYVTRVTRTWRGRARPCEPAIRRASVRPRAG